MYKLNPTFTSDFQVEPRIACYRVASYHDSVRKAGEEYSALKSESDPRKDLEQKQQNLIDQLVRQTEKLNELLGGLGKVNGSIQKSNTSHQKSEQKRQTISVDVSDVGKKDKDAKKEARKAAKVEAVKKITAGDVPFEFSKKLIHEAQWTVEDDRKTWETNLTLTVNIPPSLIAYKQEHLNNVTLFVRKSDLSWVSYLSKIGETRGVSFEGEVTNKTSERKTCIKVVKGASPALQLENMLVKSLQTIWKLIGASLGLYSRRSQQVLSASHQCIWLSKSERILNGSDELSFSTREASQLLARFDSLNSQWDISMADIVLRSLLDLSDAHSNNIETWARKIDALII